MPRRASSIEIYLPLEYNDGSPIDEAKFVRAQRELLRRFGGVTSTQRMFPLQGIWQSSALIFHDRIVVMSAMDLRGGSRVDLIRYLERLKTKLKREFRQLEVLITVQDLTAI